jgi:hypothetical protein
MRKILGTTGALLAVLMALVWSPLFGYSAPNATWEQGDVFVGVGGGSYQVYNNSGTYSETLTDAFGGQVRGCALDVDGDLYATNSSNNRVNKYSRNDPHPLLQIINTGAAGGSLPESVVFAANGDFYVGHANGNKDVMRYNAAGVLQQTYNVATEVGGSNRLDLAADQHTMFYTSLGRRVLRYDLATGTQLPDFATLPDDGGEAVALRVLPPGDGSGGVLVADTINVKRLDAAGNVVQTYPDFGEWGWFAVNLDPNGTSFWSASGDSGNFYRMNLETGEVEVGPVNVGDAGMVPGLCVSGERTAALSFGAATNTPAPTNTSTPVPPTATDTPTFTPTNTPVPPTNTPTSTNTPLPPTNTPTATATPAPCAECALTVTDVNITCNADGTVHWTAVVFNASDCALTSNWKTELQSQKNGGAFKKVQQANSARSFAPGETVVSGDMCEVFPSNITGIRADFELNVRGRSCASAMTSEVIEPCQRTQACN